MKETHFSGRAEASCVQFNATLIRPQSRFVQLSPSPGFKKKCEPSKAEVAVGAAGCLQCFYLLPADLTHQAPPWIRTWPSRPTQELLPFFFDLFWWRREASAVLLLLLLSLFGPRGGYYLFRRLCLPVFLGATSSSESPLFVPLCRDKDCDCTESGAGVGENGLPLCGQEVLMWVIFIGLWRSNSSCRNDAFALISLFPLHWKKHLKHFVIKVDWCHFLTFDSVILECNICFFPSSE